MHPRNKIMELEVMLVEVVANAVVVSDVDISRLVVDAHGFAPCAGGHHVAEV